MELLTAQHIHSFPPKPQHLMIPAFSPRPLLLRSTPTAFNLLVRAASSSATVTITQEPEVVTISEPPSPNPKRNGGRRESKRVKSVNLDSQQLKLNWLKSLSSPLVDGCGNEFLDGPEVSTVNPGWVLGVDPDLSGALAVLKPDNSAEVFDSPHLTTLVGKRTRRRLDVRSMVQLLQNINAPIGTTVYLEQSIPFPQDGKQGWWSGGFGYGLWIGVLVTSGYSVVPVPSFSWKNELKLSGGRTNKDDSRELASSLFPSMSSLLKRKKDHGRAEALLIAAYGKGLLVNDDCTKLSSIV